MSNKTKNNGLSAFAVIISVMFILLAITGVVAYFSDWFTDWSKFKSEQTEQAESGGMVIGESTESGIKLLSEKIATTDYAAYGVSALAETAYTLTATVIPSNAPNKAVDWSVSFVNGSSAWATGKTAADYVTVTPESDGALTATAECLQDFGEQIKITVVSRENEYAKAECIVDYTKKMTGLRFYNDYFNFTMGENSEYFHPTGTYDVSISHEFRYSAYTVDDTFTCKLKAEIDPTFLSAYKSALPNVSAVQSLTAQSSFTLTNGVFKRDGYADLRFLFYPDESAFINIGSTTGAYAQLVFGGNDECHNVIGTIIQNNPNCYYYTLTLTATGTYSTFTKSIKIIPDRANYTFKVRSMNISQETLIF